MKYYTNIYTLVIANIGILGFSLNFLDISKTPSNIMAPKTIRNINLYNEFLKI